MRPSVDPQARVRISPRLQEQSNTTTGAVGEVAGTNSEVSTNTEGGSQQLRLPSTLRQLAALDVHVWQQLRGLDIDRHFSLRIIMAMLNMQREYLQAKQKKQYQVGKTCNPCKDLSDIWDFVQDVQ